VTARLAITGVSIANCLGNDRTTVCERAFAGVDAFSPGEVFFRCRSRPRSA
jgi:hypothetical protein